jgi:hypothetical protein
MPGKNLELTNYKINNGWGNADSLPYDIIPVIKGGERKNPGIIPAVGKWFLIFIKQ